jgi:hypothetical protein
MVHHIALPMLRCHTENVIVCQNRTRVPQFRQHRPAGVVCGSSFDHLPPPLAFRLPDSTLFLLDYASPTCPPSCASRRSHRVRCPRGAAHVLARRTLRGRRVRGGQRGPRMATEPDTNYARRGGARKRCVRRVHVELLRLSIARSDEAEAEGGRAPAVRKVCREARGTRLYRRGPHAYEGPPRRLC